ncbi:MAG: hypothetical protein RSB55_09540, partial [Oscillospiraceae bacterium]
KIEEFVKLSGLHGEGGEGDTITGADMISVLNGQHFTAKVKDVNNKTYDYTVKFALQKLPQP